MKRMLMMMMMVTSGPTKRLGHASLYRAPAGSACRVELMLNLTSSN